MYKLILSAVLIACSLLLKENIMPVNQVLKEGQGAKPALNKPAPKPDVPAWVNSPASGAYANYNKKKKDEESAISQIKQSMQPNIFNANVPQSTVNQAQSLVNAAAQNNMFNQINQGETFSVPAKPSASEPVWKPPTRLNPLGQGQQQQDNIDPGAYVGYTGTAGYSAPYNAAQNPATMIPTYQGEPVNNSMSDTLRSMTPVTRGNGPTLSDYLRSIQSGAWTPATTPMSQQKSRYGFGSSYGGNWGGGGGGGWGGGDWGGGGDADRAAWINYMQGLYSWNIK